jgi:hypothetical protein
MTLRSKLLSSAAILGMASLPAVAFAADNADVDAVITTSAGITANQVADINYGNWLVGIASGDTPTITLGATSGGFTTAAVGSSQLINLDGDTAGTVGQVTVTLPAGADGIVLQMERSAVTDFTDGGLSLTSVLYDTDDIAPSTLIAATPVDVTVESGGVAEPVTFGGVITADATPADATHTATFNVVFSY